MRINWGYSWWGQNGRVKECYNVGYSKVILKAEEPWLELNIFACDIKLYIALNRVCDKQVLVN